MKRLIVNADDFGRTPGVNQGIIDAHRKGIVTSTTIMINYPDALAGLELAAAQAPHLGIGLHLNLTSGHPVSDAASVPSLVTSQGTFHHIGQWGSAAAQFVPAEIDRELRAQFDRFVALAGRLPDHLDAHHHATYMHPAALKTMLALAADHHLPMRHGRLDAPADEAVRALRGFIPAMSDATAYDLVGQLKGVLDDGADPWWPARLDTGFFGEHATLGDLLVILTTLPDDSLTELMCHPGYVDEALGTSGYRDERAAEVNHLTHPATRECVQAEDIQLITFADVQA